MATAANQTTGARAAAAQMAETRAGNVLYEGITGRMAFTLPFLQRDMLDAALARFGATPDTVTQEQMTQALREVVLPHLARWGTPDGETPAATPAGLLTTDADDRLHTLSPVAARLLGLAPDAAVLGLPVVALAALAPCVPTVASFADADAVRIAHHLVPTDARRVLCVSHLRRDEHGVPFGVSVTVQDISLQIALYAEADRLYHASETRVRELTALGEIGRLVALSSSLEETLAVIAGKTARVLDCRAAAIFLPNADGQIELCGQHGLPPSYMATINALIAVTPQDDPAHAPPTLIAFRTGATVYRDLRDVPPDAPDGLRAAREMGARHGWAAVVATPLVAQGERIGVLTCYLAEPRPLADDAVRLLITVADQTAVWVRNRQLSAETQRQLREAKALHESAARLNSSLDRDAVLEEIVAQAAALTGARMALLAERVEGDDVALVARAAHHADPAIHDTITRMARDRALPVFREGPAVHAIHTRQPVVVRSEAEFARQPWYRVHLPAKVQDFLAVQALIAFPFGYEGRHDAALLLLYDRPIAPTEGEMHLIGVFADHAAVAMHNTRLHAQAQQAAALEERHRLARDLHDSVTQSLFSMSLLAQSLPALLHVAPEEATHSLDELRRLSKEALAEMRALLSQLRPVALEEDGLVDALTKHVLALQRRDGPTLVFTCNNCDERLPLAVEETLFRVATEAISNALKHAHATHVAVHVEQKAAIVTLTVRDDGTGFNPAARHGEPGHLGLAGMRERVARSGGTLTIQSAVGAGTTVGVRVAITAKTGNGGL